MKKLFFALCAVFFMALTSCSDDDNKKELPVPTNKELTELCTQINANVTAIQTLVNAVTNGDGITSITPNFSRADNQASGYTIVYTSNQKSTITLVNLTYDNGSKNAPSISVKADTDNHYYWTLNGDWMLDSKKAKISAEGGVAPKLNIKNNEWQLTTDNGKNYTAAKLGSNAAMFGQIVTTDLDFVTIILSNGTNFKLARKPDLAIAFDQDDLVQMRPKTTRTIGYTISGKTEGLSVKVMTSGNVTATIEDEKATSGTLTIKTGETITENDKVTLVASTEQGRVQSSISFEESVLKVTNGTTFEVKAEGTKIEIKIETNANYTVSIPEDAKEWISAAESRAMREETVSLVIAENEGNPRNATVSLLDEDGEYFASIEIKQEGKTTVDPGETTDPTDPTDPKDPTKPGETTDPTDPTNPGGTTDPDPNKPTEPSTPTTPTIPSDKTLAEIFPDKDFRDYLLDDWGIGKNGKITQEEANKVTDIDIKDYTVSNLEGIQYFPNITELDCNKQTKLESLDLSKNTKLEIVCCDGCTGLTSLNVSGCADLKQLVCKSCSLTTLDVSTTGLGDSNKAPALSCKMPSLKTLILKKGWAINGITYGVTTEWISPDTKIEYVN